MCGEGNIRKRHDPWLQYGITLTAAIAVSLSMGLKSPMAICRRMAVR